jgi:hypothetical protein
MARDMWKAARRRRITPISSRPTAIGRILMQYKKRQAAA